MPQLTLPELKQAIASRDAERGLLVEKGKTSYRMGIELRNNPEKIESARGLWETGWKKAEHEFNELLNRNGGNMR